MQPLSAQCCRLAILAESGIDDCRRRAAILRVTYKRLISCNSARMFNAGSMSVRQTVRKFMTSAIRRSAHDDPYDGVPGYNLPFSTENRHKLLALFMVFCGSGFSIPFFMVRHQLKK